MPECTPPLMDKSIERPAKVKISTEVDALYIQLADEIDHDETVRNKSFRLKTSDSKMILVFSAAKRLLGIEILGVEDLLKD